MSGTDDASPAAGRSVPEADNLGLPEDLALVRAVTASHVLARRMRDEAVVLNMRTEQYAGFDSVGAVFWDAITTSPSLADAAFALGTRFPDVEPARLHAELVDFVEGVRTRGLVDVIPTPSR